MNKMEGKGILSYANGDQYIGSFEKDSKVGYGEYYYSTGDVFTGMYKKGIDNKRVSYLHIN